jgi:PAS domain S-box-containing protein
MMVWMADACGQVNFVNRKWLTFTGRRFRDELGNGWTASVHQEDLPPCLAAYRHAVLEQRPLLLEYRLRRSDGVYRWISDCALPLHEEDGHFAGYVGTCVDVTGQREGPAALERTVEHLRLVATHADEMIYRLRVRPHRHLEYVSPGAAGVMGLSPADVMHAPLKAIARIHPDDRIRFRKAMAAVANPASRMTFRWCLPDGRIVWAEHRHLPVFDDEGNLTAVDGVARDVTRQRELEQERDAQIAMLNGLIAHMSDGVFAETGDNHIAVVNAAFSRIFDLPAAPWPAADAAALRRMACERLENPDLCCPPAASDAFPPGELRLKDGRILEQQHFSVPLADNQVIRVWQFRDITLRKTEEEELRTSRHRLRNLSAHLEAVREEERRSLARTLHDEVGQLLTGIRLEITAAVERFREAGTPATFPVVDRLQAAIGLIDLSVASVQHVASALRPPILDHLELLSAIRWEAAIFRRRTGIRCRVSAGTMPVDNRTHATVLHRILLEALTNVARHANAGTVWILCRQRRDCVVMEVRDNGKGIPEAALSSPSSMGLLGMRERALAAGGELRVSRRPSGGTSIVVTLPLGESGRGRPGPSDG